MNPLELMSLLFLTVVNSSMHTDVFYLQDAVVLKNEFDLKVERVMKEKNRNGA
jgi:hypothetical protein